jgi:hypothetical protein
MAGVRQHILPRFLLKGFASRVQGEKVSTWVFRKGENPFETKTENVSVEKHFYGKEGEINADDKITNLEGGFAWLIDELRGKSHGSVVFDPTIADFAAHLSIRTKQIRESFRESAEFLLDQVTEYLSDPHNLKRLLLNNPEVLKEELCKRLEDIPAPQWQKDLLFQLIEINLPALIEGRSPELQKVLQDTVAEVKSIFPKAFREGHIKSLAKNPIAKPRADEYSNLKWFVCQAEHPIILGDTGCLFEVAGERRFKPIDDKGDKIINIFLPISSRKYLIGTTYSVVPQVDIKTLIQATARCSYEYFICSESCPEKAALAASIGTWAGIVSKKELEQLLTEIISDMESGPLGKKATPNEP